MKYLKNIIKKTPLFLIYLFVTKKKRENKLYKDELYIIKQWEQSGRYLPAPKEHKRNIIKKYADDYSISVLVETGTYEGETLNYFRNKFKKLISIELDYNLFNKAKYGLRKYKNIQLYNGDSGKIISQIIADIREPILFWLDGHFSEGYTAKAELNTPIISELTIILNHNVEGHVILIDDARCFDGTNDYPSIQFLQEFVHNKRPGLKFYSLDDIIRIHQ